MNEIIIENPITDWLKTSINNSKERLNFAVPFLSTFANTVLNTENTDSIIDKRIVTRFDESSLSSFDLPILKELLDLGFLIKYNNTIHLKLYIADRDTYVTSSNFTKSGFENNVELTVRIDSANSDRCNSIFEKVWTDLSNQDVTYEQIEESWEKYKLLRKRDKYAKSAPKNIELSEVNVEEVEVDKLITSIFNQNHDYSWRLKPIFDSNKLRKKTLSRISLGFETKIFYVPVGHENRKDCLFYELSYGPEVKIAGTGLREEHFRTAFQHSDFKNVISFILPESIGMKPWNLNNRDEFKEFCNGIFDFEIKCYTEALPIRLASYFYPEFFLPIFKLEDLKKVCDALGLKTNAKTKGERLFAYTTYLTHKMSDLPYGNSIKSEISYQILYTIELYKRLKDGESFNEIISDYKKKWKKEFIENGMKLLTQLGIVSS
ncbi:phospholipase D family protein [Persicobacter sp. CCB-QB2]|uniref:phospholipase D family protein n=1 Tax=Persicobacter sp. CCB-QB2 TaxID=1561025 RepID=UPI0006A9EE66|nr:phospholipase D family protein [Persicobacter sp. CCB-QB2]